MSKVYPEASTSAGAEGHKARQPLNAQRLLFIVPTGRLDPASIKRVYEVLPLLNRLGYKVKVASHRWEWLWRTRLRANVGDQQSQWLLWALNATRLFPKVMLWRDNSARQLLTRRLMWADVVIVLQTTLDPQWRQLLCEHARKIIYEIDDAVWLHDGIGFTRMIELADVVVTGNRFLAEYTGGMHPKVFTIPTGVRLDRYESCESRPKSNSEYTIGWVGSPSTVKYLSLIIEPLERLGAELPLVLEVVGSGSEPVPIFRNVQVRLHPTIPYDPVQFVPGFDVGVMPLADTAWERGKCGAKLLEYMAAGVPTVCSRVGENVRIIEDGVTGFLVNSPVEWLAALKRLASEPGLRERMGLAGRERVRMQYSSEVVTTSWHKLFRGLSEAAR